MTHIDLRDGLGFPPPKFAHLDRLTTPNGLFEHARLSRPRPAHGFCLDDVARGLVVTARQPAPDAQVRRLAEGYLDFTIAALDESGRFHNRRALDGSWSDEPCTDDHWGRGLWALGVAATGHIPSLRYAALAAASLALEQRSPWPRAMAYAALGAAEVLKLRPGDHAALSLLHDARVILAGPLPDPAWPWPEPRLTYANAVLPEALLAIGAGRGDSRASADGLALLGWLVGLETRDGRLSITPAGGWEPPEPRPAFDQQPIEVTALAEACWRAFELTGDDSWLASVDQAVGWFLGHNDVGVALYDPNTGGGYDGLHAAGVNRNQGAESTLAALATLQLGELARSAREVRAAS
ncbi:MAG: glycosyltransferase [Candidatus Nanopelagicales bacterium]